MISRLRCDSRYRYGRSSRNVARLVVSHRPHGSRRRSNFKREFSRIGGVKILPCAVVRAFENSGSLLVRETFESDGRCCASSARIDRTSDGIAEDRYGSFENSPVISPKLAIIHGGIGCHFEKLTVPIRIDAEYVTVKERTGARQT